MRAPPTPQKEGPRANRDIRGVREVQLIDDEGQNRGTMPFFDALHRYLPALSRHLGYEIACVPVVNRARSAGASKYSNLGRAAAGLFDLLGVIWLMRRTHIPSRELILRGHAETQGR